VHVAQTHEKDAVLQQLELDGEKDPPAKKRAVPYSVVRASTPAGEFHGQRLYRLKLGVIRELGESGWATMDTRSARSHTGFHYFGHFIRPGNTVVLRVPPARAKVRSVCGVLCPFTDILTVCVRACARSLRCAG
jgi:hypothetical protein